MSKKALIILLLFSLIGCSPKSDNTYFSSIGLKGYSNQDFELGGVFIDSDSKLAKEISRTTIQELTDQTFESKAYLIGSGVYREPIDESNDQIIYDTREVPILIFFQEGISQDLRGAGVTKSIESNGITIMQRDGVILKRIAISAEHLQFQGEPILIIHSP